jgi:predicted permease
MKSGAGDDYADRARQLNRKVGRLALTALAFSFLARSTDTGLLDWVLIGIACALLVAVWYVAYQRFRLEREHRSRSRQ